jgi:hypothetical protein
MSIVLDLSALLTYSVPVLAPSVFVLTSRSIHSEVTRETVVLVETVKYSATRIRVLIPSIILGYTPLQW